MTFRKYLVLAGVTVFSATGDSLLARGMKGLGNVSLHDLSSLFLAILNPWIAGGILLLLAFFASYMSALSWADLTYVLPASSLGYVLVALIATSCFPRGDLRHPLAGHRHDFLRCRLGGGGTVGYSGPQTAALVGPRRRLAGGAIVKDAYTWSAIGLIVIASTAGDVLLSHAMKRVGHVGDLWRQHGLLRGIGRVLSYPHIPSRGFGHGGGFLQPAVCPFLGKLESGRSRFRFPDLHRECGRRAHLPA